MVWNQKTFWNLAFVNSVSGLPLDITGATIDASIVRRQLSNVQDTRNGLTFDIANYTPTPDPIPLTVTNVNGSDGSCTLIINQNTWDLINSDPELEINAVDPVGFSGRIIVSFPSVGDVPEDDSVIFLLFIVRSDGVVVV